MMGAHQLPARRAGIEAEAPLSQDTNAPAVQVVDRLDKALGAAAPAAQLGDEDGVDLMSSGNARILGGLGAHVVGT